MKQQLFYERFMKKLKILLGQKNTNIFKTLCLSPKLAYKKMKTPFEHDFGDLYKHMSKKINV